MTARSYDITLFGATGYTGRLVLTYLCGHLFENPRSKKKLKVAIAGRSLNKLEGLKQEMVSADRANEALAIKVVDVDDVELALMNNCVHSRGFTDVELLFVE